VAISSSQYCSHDLDGCVIAAARAGGVGPASIRQLARRSRNQGNFRKGNGLLPSAMHASLDVEMTALEVPWDPSSAQASWADSAEDRYRRMRFVTTNNNIIQVGLCLFHKGPRDTIVARPYTFFVFPGKAPCARLRGRGYQCTRSTSDGRRCGRCTGRQQSPRES
jgi:hypothetical protein